MYIKLTIVQIISKWKHVPKVIDEEENIKMGIS